MGRCDLFPTMLCILFYIVLFQNSRNISNTRQKFPGYRIGQQALYQHWLNCVTTKLEPCRGNHTRLWKEIQDLAAPCNEPYASLLNIKEYPDSDEKKYHVSPLINTSNNTIVSFGIRHDTEAEEKLIQAIGKDNLQFYGAGPVGEINTHPYSKFGKFYPIAIARKSGHSLAEVLGPNGYYQSSALYVDAVYFLTKILDLKFFDELWISGRNREHETFPMFMKGGDFDLNGISICQFNVEVADEKQKQLHDLLFQMMDDERYAFFFPSVNNGHLRIFFINFGDELCRKKYIPKKFSNAL